MLTHPARSSQPQPHFEGVKVFAWPPGRQRGVEAAGPLPQARMHCAVAALAAAYSMNATEWRAGAIADQRMCEGGKRTSSWGVGPWRQRAWALHAARTRQRRRCYQMQKQNSYQSLDVACGRPQRCLVRAAAKQGADQWVRRESTPRWRRLTRVAQHAAPQASRDSLCILGAALSTLAFCEMTVGAIVTAGRRGSRNDGRRWFCDCRHRAVTARNCSAGTGWLATVDVGRIA